MFQDRCPPVDNKSEVWLADGYIDSSFHRVDTKLLQLIIWEGIFTYNHAVPSKYTAYGFVTV